MDDAEETIYQSAVKMASCILDKRTIHINDFDGLVREIVDFAEEPPAGFTKESFCDKILEEANSFTYSWDAAKLLAAKQIEDGTKLYPPLAKFVSRVLLGEQKRPRAGASGKNLDRDHALGMTVFGIKGKFKLPIRRDDSMPSGSLCDAVTEAAQEFFEDPITYNIVENAWKKWLQDYSNNPLSDSDSEIIQGCSG